MNATSHASHSNSDLNAVQSSLISLFLSDLYRKQIGHTRTHTTHVHTQTHKHHKSTGTTPDPLGIRLLMHWRLSLDSSDDDNASAEDLHRALDQCSKWAEQAHARVNAEGGARPAQDWGLLECLHWFLTLWSCIVDEWEAGRCRCVCVCVIVCLCLNMCACLAPLLLGHSHNPAVVK